MEKISLYPNKELKEWLEEMSKGEHRSVNNFILLVLREYKEKKLRERE